MTNKTGGKFSTSEIWRSVVNISQRFESLQKEIWFCIYKWSGSHRAMWILIKVLKGEHLFWEKSERERKTEVKWRWNPLSCALIKILAGLSNSVRLLHFLTSICESLSCTKKILINDTQKMKELNNGVW